MRREKPITFEVDIDSGKFFNYLWKRFKKYKGSQQEFYFRHVNPFKLLKKND